MQIELTQKQVWQTVPSVFATEPASSTSDRYSFIPTVDVLKHLSANGYAVVGAMQTRNTRRNPNPDARAYAKHLITLAHRDSLQNLKLNDEQPRIYLTNSHDGSSTLQLRAGVYRLVCTNGLMVSDSFCPEVKVRHTNRTLAEVVFAADTLRCNADKMQDRVAEFKSRILTLGEQIELARQAKDIRYGDAEGLLVSAHDLLQSRRHADQGSNLWLTFNRVQENIIRGGYRVGRPTSYPDGSSAGLMYARAKEIKAIDELTRINTGLWAAAETLFSRN